MLLLLAIVQQASGSVADCPSPTATIDNNVNVCLGSQPAVITANATFTVTTWQWYKDDVLIAGAPNANTLSVSEPGSYYAIATPAPGACDNTTPLRTNPVIVSAAPPVPTIVVDPNRPICSGQEFTFNVTNLSDADYTFDWDFGDGNVIARGTATVKHSYESFGTGGAAFDVTVIAISKSGGCSSPTARVPVSVQQQAEVSYTIEGKDKDGEAFDQCLPEEDDPAEAEVRAVVSNPQSPQLGNIREYFITWGLGEDEEEQRVTTFPVEGPVYEELGAYPIRIRAVNSNGCSTIYEEVFEFLQKPKAGFNPAKNDPEKPAEIEPGIGCRPVYVTMTETEETEDQEAKESTGGGLTYKWEITSPPGVKPYEIVEGGLEQKDLKVLFFDNGVYQIKLTVENACGTDEATESVVVGYPQVQLPPVGPFCGPDEFSFNSTNSFFDRNFGNEFTVSWTITAPDGSVSNRTGEDQTVNFNQIGTWRVRVLGVNECGRSDFQGPTEQEVIVLPPLTTAPTVPTPAPACIGGTTTLRASGPVAGLIYRWYTEPSGGTPIFEGAQFTTPPLSSTTNFYVEGVNSNQCVSPRATVVVNVVPGIADNTITGDQGICVGDRPATLEGSEPTGGSNTNYTYTWEISTTSADDGFTAASGVNNNQDYSPEAISATTWFRRVVRQGDCEPSISNVIQIQTVPRVENNTISSNQEICGGEVPAQLVGSKPTGGSGEPYTYLWEESTTGPNTGFVTAAGNSAGENYTFASALSQDTWYRRSVTSGGCTVVSEAIKISVFPALANNTITAPTQDECSGAAPGAITGSAPSGGSGNYTYEWLTSSTGTAGSFVPAPGTNNQQSYTPGAITQNTFFQRVVRSGQCTPNESNVVEIRIRPAITGNAVSAAQQICSGTQPAPLTGTTPSGGSGGFTYRWESSISGPSAGFNPAPGQNTGAGYAPPVLTRDTWFRRVAISAGCENPSEAVLISMLPLPNAPILTVQNARACVGEPATLTVANANGNTIEWYDAPTGGSPLFVGTTFVTPAPDRNTTFYVQARNNNNCANATRTTVSVTIVTPVADAGPDVEIIQGRPAELRATGGVTYAWEPAESLSNANVANPVARPDVTTTYTVTITTEEGCTATDEVTVTVIPAITAPNAFSPNGDRVNDVWEIGNIQNYPDARIEIFNRWGNQIFSSTGYANPWDGTYNGESLPVATYYYIIYLNSSEKPISGHVTIIR
ncbi:gliding motility-associated C-terminal domain-containing protein [Pontibacter sp. BT731]|uniref:Ig-like domain-containing protein n=1 Tax=Pontibacter coccineus TaxID=3063328 RepID=UPI0026E399C2|nr:gliding motility-associated C-terminal domain-containing protein [Pontibacter sp. BT731]MDO6390836.1 gliding motility-associated C-terminal domain-containing protein [Pontibacter sp. BT731]